MFGHESFFTENLRESSVYSVETSQIVYIRKEDFLEVLTHYQADFVNKKL